MSDMKMKILRIISEALPRMSEMEQEKLLAFGEGMAFMTKAREERATERKGG